MGGLNIGGRIGIDRFINSEARQDDEKGNGLEHIEGAEKRSRVKWKSKYK